MRSCIEFYWAGTQLKQDVLLVVNLRFRQDFLSRKYRPASAEVNSVLILILLSLWPH